MVYKIKPTTKKQIYFWNTFGSTCNAASTFFMTAVCGWIIGSSGQGIYNYANSIAAMFCVIGSFEVRNTFITDTKEEFNFRNVLGFNIITNLLFLIAAVLYIIIRRDSGYKAVVMLLFIAFRVLTNFSDSFGGLFQKHEHLEITGRSLGFYIVACTFIFCSSIVLTANLIVASAGMVLFVFFWVLFYDLPHARAFSPCKPSFEKKKLLRLFSLAAPLFLSVFLQQYFATVSKIAIDTNLNDSMQGIYNNIFMPAFVINLFSMFLYRPVVTTFAKTYAEKDFKTLFSLIKKNLLYIFLFSIFAMVVGYLIGAQVLGLFFHCNLMDYRFLIVLSLCGGMFSALNSFIYYIFVVMRKNFVPLIAYGVVCVLITIAADFMVKNFALTGAFLVYVLGMLLVSIILYTWAFVLLKKESGMAKKSLN